MPKRNQAIQEKVLGPEHPNFATMDHNRAGLFTSQVGTVRFLPVSSWVAVTLVLPCLTFGVSVENKTLCSRYSAVNCCRLDPFLPRSILISFQGKLLRQSHSLYGRCQAIQDKVLGPECPDVIHSFYNPALLLKIQVRTIRISAIFIFPSITGCQVIAVVVGESLSPQDRPFLHSACTKKQTLSIAYAYDRRIGPGAWSSRFCFVAPLLGGLAPCLSALRFMSLDHTPTVYLRRLPGHVR